MLNWKKLGRLFNPAEVTDRDWLHTFAQSPSVIFFEDYLRVYFSARPAPDSYGKFVSYTGFIDVSREGSFNVLRVSEKPVLELGQKGMFDEFGIYPSTFIRHNDVVRMYYAGWTRCVSVPFNAAIGVAESADGTVFTRLGLGPVLGYSPDEPFILGSPRIRKYGSNWYLFYVSGKEWTTNESDLQPIYKIRMATSTDGLHWNKHGKDLIPDSLEPGECQACPDIFFKDGFYHMFFSYRYQFGFKRVGRGYRIGYAWSRDLKSWTRHDNWANIGHSLDGWDSESASYPHIFELNGSIYMLYQGNHIGRDGFGLACLEGELHTP